LIFVYVRPTIKFQMKKLTKKQLLMN